MGFLSDVVAWFTTASHWQGSNGIPHRLVEHVVMSAAAVGAALLVAMPPSLLLGDLRRFGSIAINVSNVGRAIPSFAVLVLAAQVFGIGATPAFLALFVLAIPPLVTNSYVGMADVDPEITESARG